MEAALKRMSAEHVKGLLQMHCSADVLMDKNVTVKGSAMEMQSKMDVASVMETIQHVLVAWMRLHVTMMQVRQ